MEVISWQLLVGGSVVAVYVFAGRGWAIGLCVFWTLWTVSQLFYMPLILIQLGVAWGTFWILEKIGADRMKIQSLERELEGIASEYGSRTKERVLLHGRRADKERIVGEQHRKELERAIQDARREIIVLSGWVSGYVIDQRFISRLSEKLGKGVRVYFGYGWQDSGGRHVVRQSAMEALRRLQHLQAKYPGLLTLVELANHEKTLVKDDEYVIYGSNNWLSNNIFRNSERSIKIFSGELARAEASAIKEMLSAAAGQRL